jgi:hypothetical protein
VDFHWLRNLWDRSFRSARLLHRAVFCQLRAGVAAIGRKNNPPGGSAGVYLSGTSEVTANSDGAYRVPELSSRFRSWSRFLP